MTLQPILENEQIVARPLKEDDFETLYKVASDPLIWDQHPNKNRYQRAEFRIFFQGAMASKGAFLVLDKKTGEVIGSSRFYDWDEHSGTLLIGYTFFSRNYWGNNYNHSLKRLMIDHAFTFAKKVVFHIGAQNYRSQRSIEKLNAVKTGEIEVEYFGEPAKLNFTYEIEKKDWQPEETNYKRHQDTTAAE